MPYWAAILTTAFASNSSSGTGSVGLFVVGSPTSSKKRSCKPRSMGHQHSAGLLSHVLVSMQVAPWDIDERSCTRPRRAALNQELILPTEHPEGLVLSVLDVEGGPVPGCDATSKSEYAPPV